VPNAVLADLAEVVSAATPGLWMATQSSRAAAQGRPMSEQGRCAERDATRGRARSLGLALLLGVGLVATVVGVLVRLASPAAAAGRPPLAGGHDDGPALLVAAVLVVLVVAIAVARWVAWVRRRRVPSLARVGRPAASPAAGRPTAAGRPAVGPGFSRPTPGHGKDRR
jgi:hypothetical protein